MKHVTRVLIPIAGIAFVASSMAQTPGPLASDYTIFFSVDSVGDLSIDGLSPVQLGLEVTSNALLSLDDPNCITSGCQGDLNYLRITLNDFDVEMQANVNGQIKPAVVFLDDPTITI